MIYQTNIFPSFWDQQPIVIESASPIEECLYQRMTWLEEHGIIGRGVQQGAMLTHSAHTASCISEPDMMESRCLKVSTISICYIIAV